MNPSTGASRRARLHRSSHSESWTESISTLICSDLFGGHITQFLSSFRRIDPKLEELPRRATSRPGAFHRHIRIAAEREHLLPPLETDSGTARAGRLSASRGGRDSCRRTPYAGSERRLVGQPVPGRAGELPSRPADGLILRHELWAAWCHQVLAQYPCEGKIIVEF